MLALIFAFVAFMAYSAFSWMGLLYVAVVPIPLVIYSIYFRKSKAQGGQYIQKPINLWTSPIPYLSIIFVALIIFNLIG